MATTVSIQLDDTEEATLIKFADEANAIDGTSFTPIQVFRGTIRNWIRQQTSRFAVRDSVSREEAYKLATPEDRAAINSILDKYRT